ncbi:DUF853 domain-containing protein [Polaromonas sp. P1(28)-13]|nr:DUF853 domain-containing protein [Polaromonas sp. P1(28)-13]
MCCRPAARLAPSHPNSANRCCKTRWSPVCTKKTVDRESAYEKIKGRADVAAAEATKSPNGGAVGESGSGGILGGLNDVLFGSTGPRGGRHEGLAQSMAKSAVRTMGSAVGREIIRGVLGSIFGGKR